MEIVKIILLIIISPKAGWDDVNQSAIPTGRIQSQVFLPLLAVLAITTFVPMVFDTTLTLQATLMQAIISFSAYYLTYYLTSFLLGGFYPELVQGRVATDRMNDYVMYNLVYLVLLSIIKNILPVDFAPIFFMMFYLPYIAYKGTEYLGVEKHKVLKFTLLASAMMIAFPQLINYVLGLIIK